MNPKREEALFALALEKPVEKRAELLDRECNEDPALRQRLEALLAAHEQPEGVLAEHASTAKETMKIELADVRDESIGRNIDRYQLLELPQWPNLIPAFCTSWYGSNQTNDSSCRSTT